MKDSFPHLPAVNNDLDFESLVGNITRLVGDARDKAVRQINSVLVQTNWQIGRYIVEFEQQGSHRAKYGEGLLTNLSKRLTFVLGKGFSRPNLNNMRKFYLQNEKCQTLSDKLSWSHHCEIIGLDDPLEREFYIREAVAQRWNVRTLHRQMESGLFMRLALSKDKAGILQLAHQGQQLTRPADVVKDNYVLDLA